MPRILHTADLHLGIENYGRLDPATGLSSRLLDFLSAFDEAVEYTLTHDVGLFLFCGDVYKTRDPNPTTQREFARRIARLIKGGVAVFLLVGNHDVPNAISRATSVEIFDTLAVQDVHVAARAGVYPVATRHGVVQVAALPWMPRSALLAREDYKDLPPGEINAAMAEKVDRVVKSLAERIDPSLPAVLAAHSLVAGARVGTERFTMLGPDLVLNPSVLTQPAFSYVALGHVHKQQIIGSRPPLVYPGSLQRVDFSEEKEDKGFYVVDIVPRGPDDADAGSPFTANYDFVRVKARPFVTIDVDADTEDPTAAVLAAIAGRDVRDAVVRLRISISARREGLLREGEIRRALKEANFIAAIGRNVVREDRSRVPADEDITRMPPLQALKLYLQTKHVPPDRAAHLVQYAERLLAEE